MLRRITYLLYTISALLGLAVFTIALGRPSKTIIGSHSQWVIQRNDSFGTGIYVTYWHGPYTIIDLGTIFHRTHLPIELLLGVVIFPAAVGLLVSYACFIRSNPAFGDSASPEHAKILSQVAFDLALLSCVMSCMFLLGDNVIAQRIVIGASVIVCAVIFVCGILVRPAFVSERKIVTRAYCVLIINVLVTVVLLLLQPSV